MKMAIITVATGDYLRGARALFYSLKLSTDVGNVDLICLSDTTAPDAVLSWLNVGHRKIVGPPADISSSATVARFKTTLMKFEAFRLLEDSHYERVIFLDSDMLVLSDVSLLLSEELNGEGFWAARDLAGHRYYFDAMARAKVDPCEVFNTGCFVANRRVLESLTYATLVRASMSGLSSYDGGDQGYLNAYFASKDLPWGELPISYNFTSDLNYPIQLVPPRILHFTGTKPWVDDGPDTGWDAWFHMRYRELEAELARRASEGTAPPRLHSRILDSRTVRCAWSARTAKLLPHKAVAMLSPLYHRLPSSVRATWRAAKHAIFDRLR